MKTTQEMIAGINEDIKRLAEIKQEADLLNKSIPIDVQEVVNRIGNGEGSGDLIKDLVIINHTKFDAPELEKSYRDLQDRLKGNVGKCIFVKEKKAYRPFASYPNRTVGRERISLGVLNGESLTSGLGCFAYSYFLPVDKFVSYWNWQPSYPREKFRGHKKMHVPLFQVTEKGLLSPAIFIGSEEIDAYLSVASDDELLFFMEVSQELGVNFSSDKLSEFARMKAGKLLKEINTLKKILEFIEDGAELKNYDLGSATEKLKEALDEAGRLGIKIPT